MSTFPSPMQTPTQRRIRRQTIVACIALVGAVGLAVAAILATTGPTSENARGENFVRGLRIQDGDTLETRSGRHVRLLCIDAPERDQPGGVDAQDALKTLVANGAKLRTVGKDRYGRFLAVASARKDGGRTIINAEMVRRGHAWVFRRFAKDCGMSRRELCAMEKEARLARRGLWNAENPVPPWRWRQGRTRPPNRFPPCEK